MVVVVYLSLSGGWLSLFITWLISFIFKDVTSALVKCVVLSGCAWKTLSIFWSFALLFWFANFVNWRLLSDYYGIWSNGYTSIATFFRNFVEFRTFTWTATFAFTELRLSSVLMTLFFPFTSSLKKLISLLSEEISLWRLQRSSSRCPFSFMSLGSCCFTSRRMACFSCILAALW